jgi:FKBP-type peptidyl-prolyl cis-trans isomerase SlyD
MFDRFRMKIEKNTIVSLRYKLTDAQNNVIEEPDSPMVYLHGGYEGTFPKIETLLDGQDIGYEATIQLEPSEAFGEYDPELLKIEPRTRFPEPLEVGMQFEGFQMQMKNLPMLVMIQMMSQMMSQMTTKS